MTPEYRLISDIKPNPKNPRVIKDDKYKLLLQSLKDFPQMLEKRPLVCFTDIDGKVVVLGGNMRLKAATELGIAKLPIVLADDWTEEQRAEFLIKDNVGFGEWDWEQLQADWDVEQLADWGVDIPAFVTAGEAVEDDYDIPDDIETDIVAGDLFEIGQHRLLCGSSTEADAVSKLLDGKEPYLMITDPPYGVSYDASWRLKAGVNKPWQKRAEGKVSNDDNADWVEAWVLSPAKVAYVWHGGVHSTIVAKSLIDSDFIIRSQIIWHKPSLVMGRGHYHWQHEPCWYAVKKGSAGNWAGDRKQSTVWDIQNMHRTQGNVDDGKTSHSTQKPVECMARPINNHDGDVYDPFLGSGTTMVAAHQLNRKCYGMEIDPKYCQCIVDRMLKLDTTLTIIKNGVPLVNAISEGK